MWGLKYAAFVVMVFCAGFSSGAQSSHQQSPPAASEVRKSTQTTPPQSQMQGPPLESPPSNTSDSNVGLSSPPQKGEPQQVMPASQATKPIGPIPQPLGTGAAPEMVAGGVTASRPAGAAIAPAKQKRTLSFSVRTALVVGGAVALGVVTGLTLATSGRPR